MRVRKAAKVLSITKPSASVRYSMLTLNSDLTHQINRFRNPRILSPHESWLLYEEDQNSESSG